MRKLSAKLPEDVKDTLLEVHSHIGEASYRIYVSANASTAGKKDSLSSLQKSIALLELRLAKLKVWIRQQELALNDAD
jgi:hypothetical protein